jgi:hypothetical protein
VQAMEVDASRLVMDPWRVFVRSRCATRLARPGSDDVSAPAAAVINQRQRGVSDCDYRDEDLRVHHWPVHHALR